MNTYETIVIYDPALTTDEITANIDKVKGKIDNAGELVQVEEWGKRKLAYLINNKYTEGHYVLFEYKGTKELLDDLEHSFRISANVIRHMIVKKED